MRNAIRTGVTHLLLLCMATGCSVVTLKDGFVPMPADSSSRSRVSLLEVSQAGDVRPLQGRTSIGPGFLAIIPLVPYGRQKISPEFAGMASSLTTESLLSDLLSVVVTDLRAADVADQVVMHGVNLQDLGAEAGSGPPAYSLRLTLDEGIYHRNMTLYGLSFAGAFLWMIGLPVSYGSANLALTAELLDPAGELLGKQSFEARSRATEWLYRPFQPAYSPAMPRAYGEISPQLRQFVETELAR
jgi:hypothetical protein